MLQMGRYEHLGSGVRNVTKCLPFYSHGAKPVFDEQAALFVTTIPLIEPASGEVAGQVEAQVEAQVDLRILKACSANQLSSANIAAALGHKQLSGNVRKALFRMKRAALLEYTIPDKPRSSNQKYRLTEKGKTRLRDKG